MQSLIDALRKRAVDASHTGQFLDARAYHALQSAELTQQVAPLLRAETGYGLQDGRRPGSGAALAMARDCETMRLVAHLLYEMQCRRIGRQDERELVAQHE